MSIDLEAIKQGQRTMWSAGDYADIARTIAGVAELLVERVQAGPGDEMLDVATGSGNVAIPAALAGASVVGLDLTPKLLVRRARGVPADGRADARLRPTGSRRGPSRPRPSALAAAGLYLEAHRG